MSIAKDIAPQLAYLRRFARALSGSQHSGDAYVVALLEALVAEPASFPKDVATRVGLYKMFIRLWSSVSLNSVSSADTGKSPGQKNLDLLTPKSRQAFLLRTVEGFPIEDVATILDVTSAEVDALLTTAGREIAQQVATDVLIIEDEPLIAMDIETLLVDLGHRVIGIARTHGEAVEMVKTKQPGLILTDINLADGSSGLDAVNEILNQFNVPVIFITAYPERLLTGQKPEPAFLITKPFQTEMVKALISQSLFFERKAAKSAA
jgi:CheY-like chemotaxis protein